MFQITNMALEIASNEEIQDAIKKCKKGEMNQSEFDKLREKIKKEIKKEKGWK